MARGNLKENKIVIAHGSILLKNQEQPCVGVSKKQRSLIGEALNAYPSLIEFPADKLLSTSKSSLILKRSFNRLLSLSSNRLCQNCY